jgi:multidrug efflux pump subunit AcrA (membrane-fusion protein)
VEWPKNLPNSQKAVFAVYKKTFSGKLEPAPVKIGESDGRMTEITEGLKEGEEIVIIRKKEKPQSANPFSPGGAPKKNETQRRS